jgi:hypothetical protein
MTENKTAQTTAPAAAATTTSAPAKPWDGKTKVIKVSTTNGPSVEVKAPDFQTLAEIQRRTNEESDVVALCNQAFTVALQAGARRVLVKEGYKNEEERAKAVQDYVNGYVYGVRTASGDGVKRVSVDKVKTALAGSKVQFSDAQKEALRAAGIDI